VQSSFVRFSAAAIAAAVLTACNAGGSQFAPPPTTLADAPQAKASGDVLFVSDSGNNTLSRFSYLDGKYLGQVTGLREPRGLCGDAAGNVWVANAGSSTLTEYSHDGAQIGSLHDDGYEPYSCAIDPTSGDLAVANIFSSTNGAGNLAIFSHASGSPAFYAGGDINFAFYVAYAPTGALYIDGLDSDESFRYASFAHGKFNDITIQGTTIAFPGPLAWSTAGNSVDIADQQSSPPAIYRLSRSGRVQRQTDLQCSSSFGLCDIEAFAIDGNRVLADTVGPGVQAFRYPQGGPAVKTIGANQLSQPFGLALSAKMATPAR
jgi:hypothetical protein